MKNLFSKNLVEFHQQLTDFATYHQNKGGQKAHRLIKEQLIDNLMDVPRDGSKEGMLRDEGYEKALKDVFSLLYKEFVA